MKVSHQAWPLALRACSQVPPALPLWGHPAVTHPLGHPVTASIHPFLPETLPPGGSGGPRSPLTFQAPPSLRAQRCTPCCMQCPRRLSTTRLSGIPTRAKKMQKSRAAIVRGLRFP